MNKIFMLELTEKEAMTLHDILCDAKYQLGSIEAAVGMKVIDDINRQVIGEFPNGGANGGVVPEYIVLPILGGTILPEEKSKHKIMQITTRYDGYGEPKTIELAINPNLSNKERQKLINEISDCIKTQKNKYFLGTLNGVPFLFGG
jgi:hypothetical protein